MLFPLLFLSHAMTTLEVGDGHTYTRVEDAVAAASPGDEIDVYPRQSGYSGTAVRVKTSGLKIIGIGKGVRLDGGSFEYSGQGSVPRAIFQVEPNADRVVIQNLELTGAHNKSFNGAGVRINAAKNCSVLECEIHDCDMGIMSAGIEGDPHAGENQLIDHCHIHHNGNTGDPGYNHNLYLGGTSVTLRFCQIDHSLTGHNLKSRAHFTLVQHCEIFSASSRECDFVDSWDTKRPDSNVVLLGNVINKDPDCTGNKGVINFGQESGQRDGTIYLLYNTINTPFHSAVLSLTSATAKAVLVNNLIENVKEAHPVLVSVDSSSSLTAVTGTCNVISPGYDVTGTKIDPTTLYTDTRTGPSRLPYLPVAARYTDGDGARQPARPTHRHSKEGWVKIKNQAIGAGE